MMRIIPQGYSKLIMMGVMIEGVTSLFYSFQKKIFHALHSTPLIHYIQKIILRIYHIYFTLSLHTKYMEGSI